jgi:dGTPase
MLEWGKLLCSDRRPKADAPAGTKSAVATEIEYRTEIERDYDRILFSTPVRRMADKTQVFPLEKNDSVRTRLTHSHEVSNLARSIGTALVHRTSVFDGIDTAPRDVPAMLAAIGLAHDLGNPPFGHQGEKAIGKWFADHFAATEKEWGDSQLAADKEWEKLGITDRMRKEFLKFEGNAQTLRILTKLQLLNDNRGLNLTLGTLGAIMKYPVAADQVDKSVQSRKKHNYFQSEDDVVDAVRAATGLSLGVRHPLTFVMEACDDIAYSVLDVEDAIKKGLVSISDVLAWLDSRQTSGRLEEQELTASVLAKSKEDYKRYREETLSPTEFNDVSMQKLRVYAIASMVRAVIERFDRVSAEILRGTYNDELIADSAGGALRTALKDFATEHAYKHRSVLEVELRGYNVIRGLMDLLWDAISATRRKNADPFQRYVYGRISENYRRVAEAESNLPERYRDYQLLTDMVSGMTDSFAMDVHSELLAFRKPPR